MRVGETLRRFAALFAALLLAPAVPGCVRAESGAAGSRTIRILATSDLHGKFLPWDYSLNAESADGSAAQLATAVAAWRTDAALLVDAGDLIQGNFAELFVHGTRAHPMVRAMNRLGYDVWVTGNHDYNYGMDVLRGTIADLDAAVLTGNVYDGSGAPIADGYRIFDLDGVRVAVIGMVTPNIARWDERNLRECTVTDPLTETRAIIDGIRGQYDALIGVYHMGIQNEYGVPNSGVTDICNACPEFDAVVSSHEHRLIPSMDINGVLVVQNKPSAQTMAVIDLCLEPEGNGWKTVKKTAGSVSIADYAPDPAIAELLETDHIAAQAESVRVIGVLKGGPLIDPSEEVPSPLAQAQVRDTELIDLVNRVQLYYSGARVSAAPLCDPEANLEEGDIRLCDTARIYSFNNTLYTVGMNGGQLKKLMEWTAGYFAPADPGTNVIAADPDFPSYNYLMFAGVGYEIDLTRPVGSRIMNLAWPDGTPVGEKDSFTLAINNYNASSHVLSPGEVFSGDDLPVLAEMDVRGDLGGIRELIRDYIIYVRDGVLTPECDHSWRIVTPE